MMCAIKKDFDTGRSLLQEGCNLTDTDQNGRNALWYSILFKNGAFMRFLLGKVLQIEH